jgi:hypothetical protein
MIFFNNGVLSYLKLSPVKEILRPCGGFAQMQHTSRKKSFDQIKVIRSWLTWVFYANYKIESHNRAQSVK